MSSSSEFADSGSFSGPNTPVSAPAKPNFSHTCNLFSQYLKGNQAFPDLTLGRSAQPTATMNLFPVVETPRATVQPPPTAVKQQDQSRTMTLFYNGQVVRFDDLDPEKVKEILKFAEEGADAQKPLKADESLKKIVSSDLPIARKASIARFLEKRKDRVMARSPYQAQDVSKEGEKKTWLGLGAQSH